ncbi:MAG: glycosyltransferase family 87 protein [Chloroflexota bacterium]
MSPNMRAPRSSFVFWLPVAAIGWAGFVLIATQLASLDPSRFGDDLRLLVDAGIRWRDGAPLYATMPPGTTLEAESLFYSYPPLIAQAMSLVAGIPFPAIFVAWAAGAVGGLWLVAERLGRDGRAVVWPALALAPYVYPLAVALLLGNVNAWFPASFGLVLAAVLAGGQGSLLAGGAALAVAAAAKLHPASLGLWLLVRGVRDARSGRSSRALQILAVAAAIGLGMLTISLAMGGLDPWADYLAFLRESASAADVVSPLNVGPASQVAFVFGLSDASARTLQVGITIVAIAGTAAAAWALDDRVESFAWATVASLVVLPVTWFHYLVALVPVALVAASRAGGEARRRTALLLAASIITAALAILAPAFVWVAAAFVLVAARASGPPRGGKHP